MDDLSDMSNNQSLLKSREEELSKLEAEARLYDEQLEELEKNGTNEQGIGGN